MKGKKLLAGILSAAMVLGTMAMPVFAEGSKWADSANTDWYTGTESEYTLSTAAELAGLASLVNGGTSFNAKTIKLGSDIDLEGIEWTPIGRSGKTFQGIFDGNGNTIKNLSITKTYSHAGLFGFTTNGEIKNFTLENAFVDASDEVGAVAGTPYNSKYTDITVKGSIQVNGFAYVGGALGKSVYANITNVDVIGDKGSYVKAMSGGYRTYVGGLIGFMGEGDKKISDCDVVIDVTGSTCDVGGVSGNLHYGCKLIDCTYKGNLALTKPTDNTDMTEIGGLVGTYLTDPGCVTSIEGCSADIESAMLTDTKGTTRDIKDEITATGAAWNGYSDMGEHTVTAIINGREEKFTNNVANIGDVKYFSFASALAAAQDGDTITLLSDVETSGFAHDKAITLDLNGKTLKFDENTVQNDVKSSITYKNGTIDISGIDIKANSFWFVTTNGKLNFDNVKLYGNEYNSAFCVIYFVVESAEANFNNSTVELANDGESSGFIKGDGFMGKAVFNNTSVSLENTGRGFASTDASFNNSKVTIAGTTANGIENAFNLCKLTVTDSTIDISGCSEYGIKLGDEAVEVKGKSKVKVEESGIADIVHRKPENTGVLTVEENATVIAENIGESVLQTTNGNGTIVSKADEISVEFEPANTEENIYNIKLKGANLETINRLTSADLTFKLETSDDISYELLGVDKITITPKDDNRYMFSLDGVTAPDITNSEITIAQVKFNGYGTFSFKIDDAETNVVNATAISDNLVESFYVGGQAEGKGELNISEKLENVTISVPTKKLTIKIAMNNSVADQVKAYQDMKVDIAGGDYSETIALGSDATKQANKVYTVEKELPVNTAYTVTVTGAGYRTARYTVNLTNDKTLNFWNNVADNAIEVEIGNEAYKKDVTFLAGDIVKDSKINIYDLSAVVSYFGTSNNVDEKSEYAKYDLNRDGKIDSKDVAYVLVSWGK